MSRFYPDDYVSSIYKIDFDELYNKGFRGALFDVDNTLVPFDLLEAPEELIAFFKSLQDKGFEVGLVSNNTTNRVAALNEKLGLEMMPNAMKPFTFKLRKILSTLKVPHEKAVFVGDQLFTDVWVGNRLGLYTILVEPIQQKEQLITKVKRGTEKLVLKGYKRKS